MSSRHSSNGVCGGLCVCVWHKANMVQRSNNCQLNSHFQIFEYVGGVEILTLAQATVCFPLAMQKNKCPRNLLLEFTRFSLSPAIPC